MIIKSMTASFGRLEQAHLGLQNGLNILHAPNEGGKSTWCAFIRAMFYGINTRDRDKKGYLADKNRYLPWSGAPMEGELVLEWKGRDITLRRFTKGATPFGGFSAVYSDTQQPVPELTAQNCGEVLLGVGREVWERSAFIGSAPTLAIDGTPELERRIAALFSSGEEDVSFSQTDAKLREWLRRRQHNKSGIIPKLEEELARINRTLTQMADASDRLAQVQNRRPALQQLLQELESEMRIHDRLARRAVNHRYADALEERSRVLAQLDALRRQQEVFGPLPHRDLLRDAQTRLQRLTLQEETLTQTQEEVKLAAQAAQHARDEAHDPRFSGLDGSGATARAHQARTEVETLLAKANSGGRGRKLLLCLIPALMGAGAAFALPHLLLPILLGAVLLTAVCAALVLSFDRANQQTLQQAQQLLAQYNVTQPDQITAAAEEYRARLERSLRLQEDADRQTDELADRRRHLEEEQADLLSFVRTFAPQTASLSGCTTVLTTALELEDRLRQSREQLALAQSRCDDLAAQGAQETDTLEALHTPDRSPEQTRQTMSQTQAQLAELDRQEALTRGELSTLGDRAGLESHAEVLAAQLERRRKEYQAISLALDALGQANAQLQQRFAPELNRRSGQILSALTNGRYDTLTLDREFDAAARSTDSLLPHSALALSRGTADQIYLAVRLAVCQLCLSAEEPSPLVLDDALLTFDDGRMALAVDYLAKTGQQVLLFSCQQRERQLGIGHILPLQS